MRFPPPINAIGIGSVSAAGAAAKMTRQLLQCRYPVGGAAPGPAAAGAR